MVGGVGALGGESESGTEVEREKKNEKAKETKRKKKLCPLFFLSYDLRRDQDVPGRVGSLVDELGEPQGRELLFFVFCFGKRRKRGKEKVLKRRRRREEERERVSD